MVTKYRLGDKLLRTLIWLSGLFVILLLAAMIAFLLYKGLPSIHWDLLTTAPSELKGTKGFLPMIINTVYIIIITLLIATPIGIGSAIYLNEYAKKGIFVTMVEFTTETLSGIPSIVYGLFGFAFFATFMKLQYSILTGALTLTIIVLPTIIRTTQEALKTVPQAYREGALGLGATKFHVIRTILIPSASPGIIAAVILSVGRIVGESAALIFTAGLGYSIPNDWIQHIHDSGATLTVQLYLYAMRGENLDITFAMAAVLVLIVLVINISTNFISKRFYQG